MSFLDNVKAIWKKESFWVATAGAAIVGAWPMMPDALKTDVFHAFPMLQIIAPAVWLVTFVIARVHNETPDPAVGAVVTPTVTK